MNSGSPQENKSFTWPSMLILALFVAGMVVATSPAAAQVARTDGYQATLTNIEGRTEVMVKVDLVRWSTDEERQQVVRAWAIRAETPPEPPPDDDADDDADDADDTPEVPLDPEERFVQALREMPTVGVVWTDESGVGYTLRYAHREPMAGGGDRVVLIADRRLGTRAYTSWEPSGVEAQAYPYTVIEMHLAEGGTSEGKLSLSAAIAGDPVSSIFGLWNYAAAPVHLEGVTRVP